MSLRTLPLVAVAALMSVLSVESLAAVATFQGLGKLDGFAFSSATAISDDGWTVVGTAFDESGSQAFRWTKAGGLVGLGGTDRSFANGVNGDGSAIVGRVESPGSVRGFRWTATDGLIPVTAGANETSEFHSVSADGNIVAGYQNVATPRQGQEQRATTWTPANGFNPFGTASDTNASTAFSISANGSVVVGSNAGQAFRFTSAGGVVGLGTLDGDTNSLANDVSPDGAVVVGDSSADNRQRAFRWTAATGMLPLSDSATDDSIAFGVSGDGDTIVGRLNGQHAFLWTESEGVTDLQLLLESQFGVDLTGWTLSNAYDISADGRTIVGDGLNPSGATEVWVVTLSSANAIPMPSPLLGGAAGLLVASVCVCRSMGHRTP